jgi:uncharacterized protein with GYD domain
MPKYLAKAKFTKEGLEGLRKGGAAGRLEAGRIGAASVGGTMECYYFAFGEHDAYTILDLPDDEAATALSLAANSAGLAAISVTKLLTAEQVDEAFRRTVDYRPPGR